MGQPTSLAAFLSAPHRPAYIGSVVTVAMASSEHATAAAMVTIKVNFDGEHHRFKLPLRDMGIGTFEDKLRRSLRIAADQPCVIERYSDSAGSFVVLDRTNTSVYKQLYRAAKAKSKLKIRVTVIETPKVDGVEEEQETPEATPTTVEELAEQPASVLEVPVQQTLEFDMPIRPRSLALVDEASTIDQTDRSVMTDPYLRSMAPPVCPFAGSTLEYRVCCNSCERTIPDIHYHCTKCDDDDFDLCLACVESGITCYGPDHWLVKRFKKDGIFVSSTTETLTPSKLKVKKESTIVPSIEGESYTAPEPKKEVDAEPVPQPLYSLRACNCCVQERPEHHFLHCTSCEDFDLCTSCFAKDAHGHHPKHAFVPAVANAYIPDHIAAKLSPGRNQTHHAICDKCDKFIRGIRHKCLDCPDWDYCSECVAEASTEHVGHRFAPIYEPLSEPLRFTYRTVHEGICCDGPLCESNPIVTYITGVRYKCAVCPDTDFCAACEAHPSNTHNKTHPLIKFRTAVRHALVSTTGVDRNGKEMPLMGDAPAIPSTRLSSKPTSRREPTMSSPRSVVNVEPSEPASVKEEVVEKTNELETEEKTEEIPAQPEMETRPAEFVVEKLSAVYVHDTVMDGTVLPPNHVFEQTWVLRNTGNVAWPAGCAVKFVGGDYMGHVDSNHPAGISELVSASESTVCYEALEPGKDYPFTVLLRTPPREGKVISYWRLTTPDGIRFGHRLWCDVNVQEPKVVETTPAVPQKQETKQSEPIIDSSQMVFPKLDKESPVSSIHQDIKKEEEEEVAATLQDVDFDDLEGEVWDGSDEGFLTDEEYDILDASDEEYLEEQRQKAPLRR